jgi:transposase
MFIRTKSTAKPNKKKVQICESIRQGDRVKQVIVQHVGIAHDAQELDSLKRLGKVLITKIRQEREGPFLFPIEQLEESKDLPREVKVPPNCVTSKPIEGVQLEKEKNLIVDLLDLSEQQRRVEGFHEVFGKLFNSCGFHQILSKKKSEVLKELVLARIASPSSKRGSQEMLTADFGINIPLDRIYRMMDPLLAHESDFQKAVFFNTQSLCFEKVLMTFFDVTTLYFESIEEDELRKFGYSKDQQFHSVQVVVALATTQEGLPIGYKTFPGNTAEVSTLLKCLDEWKVHLPIGEVTVIADRAMMSEENLSSLENAGIKYVIAAKLKKLPKEIRGKLLSERGEAVCLQEETYYVQEHNLQKGRRLIATYNDKRARKDKQDRERLLEKIHKKIGSGKNPKNLVSNRGYQKYLKVEGEGKILLDEDKLAQEEEWDGLHGIITNDTNSKGMELLGFYRRQWIIEESFRIHKTDLSVRPIYHFKPERVQAHLLLCYLAFALMRYAEYRIGLQKEKISMQEMRKALWRTQSSILKDHKTGKLYRVPSKTSSVAKDIYQTFGLVRNEKIQEIEQPL